MSMDEKYIYVIVRSLLSVLRRENFNFLRLTYNVVD